MYVCVIVFYHIIVTRVCVCGLFPAPTRWGLPDRKNKLRVCRYFDLFPFAICFANSPVLFCGGAQYLR